MALSLVTNVASLNAQRNLAASGNKLEGNTFRLSSGLRINRAADDAAGLAISENLKAQIRSLGQAERNANDGLGLMQTAEGGMNEISGMLTRMRELAMQSASDTLGSSERGFVQLEIASLLAEVDRVADVTVWNGIPLLDGSATNLEFQVGIHNTANDRITMSVDDVRSTVLGTSGGGAALGTVDLSTKTGAQSSLAVIDQSIIDVSDARADIGAIENRMQVTMANLATARQNLAAANSRIRDVDVAEESADMTRNDILMQAGVSILAQANQLPSLAVQLLS